MALRRQGLAPFRAVLIFTPAGRVHTPQHALSLPGSTVPVCKLNFTAQHNLLLLLSTRPLLLVLLSTLRPTAHPLTVLSHFAVSPLRLGPQSFCRQPSGPPPVSDQRHHIDLRCSQPSIVCIDFVSVLR
ncbi:hypothetical protein M011DRAFT_70369 [Sporormia fimetaria CBS 119925]|uniref:Uncharacterized protein n=1 Tax=Sporormia fimetaria CBS 119925 TaxID=1340428 RepID=A0A6A6VB11_9PLEO|nr:hypothetical protein M011DRAFT_70369 [Sporormia fimetaria CBS 119925]